MPAFIALAAAAVLAVAALPSALAQRTNATCLPDYNWMQNSKGQSPCLIASYLQSACFSPWNVRDLPAGNAYNIPAGNSVSLCGCSSAVYNTMAACSACQGPGRSWHTWPQWISSCGSTVPDTAFPVSINIPGATEIPPYAMRLGDRWTDDNFNTREAQLIAQGQLDPAATGTGSIPSSTPEPSPSATPASPTPAPSSEGTPLGPIIGGVVGGVLGLLLIATLAYYIRSKHRRDARRHNLAEAQNMIIPQSPPPMSISSYPIRPIAQQIPSYATSQGGGSSNPSYHGHYSSPSVDSTTANGNGGTTSPYLYSPAHGHQRSLSQTISMTQQPPPPPPPPQMSVVRSNTTAQQQRPLSPQSPTFSEVYSSSGHDDLFFTPQAQLPPGAIPVPLAGAAGVQAPQPLQLSEKAQLRERERQRAVAESLSSPAPPAYSTPAPQGHQLVAIGDGTETWVSGSSQAGATGGEYSGSISGPSSPVNPGLNRAFSMATRNGDELQSYLGLRLATQSPGGLSTYSSTAAGDMYGGSSNAGDWPNEKS